MIVWLMTVCFVFSGSKTQTCWWLLSVSGCQQLISNTHHWHITSTTINFYSNQQIFLWNSSILQWQNWNRVSHLNLFSEHSVFLFLFMIVLVQEIMLGEWHLMAAFRCSLCWSEMLVAKWLTTKSNQCYTWITFSPQHKQNMSINEHSLHFWLINKYSKKI